MITPALFTCVMPGGIAYSDRRRTVNGDYKRIAFLAFQTLELRVAAPRSDLLDEIRADAATYQKRRGELTEVSACGQTTILGWGLGAPESLDAGEVAGIVEDW